MARIRSDMTEPGAAQAQARAEAQLRRTEEQNRAERAERQEGAERAERQERTEEAAQGRTRPVESTETENAPREEGLGRQVDVRA